jgi:hypothetical protein
MVLDESSDVSSPSRPEEPGKSSPLTPPGIGAETANENDRKSFSADDAETAQLHALTRETYTMSLRQLRQERQLWRADKMELEYLREAVADDTSTSITTQFQGVLQEKAQHEEQLESYHEEIQALKEQVHSMQTEQKDLKKELAESQQQQQEERYRRQEPGSQSSNTPVDPRRIQDLEEQINKWEVLFFESAEMGERQIERLEQELEQVREELEETKDATTQKKQNDEKVKRLQEQVDFFEKELRQRDELVESERKSPQQREDELKEKLQEVSNKAVPTSTIAPDPFANRLAALAKEMNNRELVTHKQHETERQANKEKISLLNSELKKAYQKIGQLEKQLEMSRVIHEEQEGEEENSSRGDNSSASSGGNEELDQYMAELERQQGQQKKELEEVTDRLDQERIVSKNREGALKRQLEDAQGAIAMAKNREALLDKELEERKPINDRDADIDNVILEGLLGEVQQTKEELEKSKAVAKELRQKLEISLQAKQNAPSLPDDKPVISTSQGGWDSSEREKLQARIDSQQQELEAAERRLEATQRENSQLRQVKDSLMGIDREMEDLIESLEPLQNELSEKTKQAEEARDEAAAFKQELNKETAKRQETEREKSKLEKDIVETKERLNQVYMQLKDEQALREDELDRTKQELFSTKESLEYHKTSLEVLTDALREANEEIRNSAPGSALSELGKDTGNQINEVENVCAERDKLEKDIQDLRAEMDKRLEMAEGELKALRQKLGDLESEKDAFELEASMAMQERNSMEENLRRSSRTIASLQSEVNGGRKPSRDSDVGKQKTSQELRNARDSAESSLRSQLEQISSPEKLGKEEVPQFARKSVKDMLRNFEK